MTLKGLFRSYKSASGRASTTRHRALHPRIYGL